MAKGFLLCLLAAGALMADIIELKDGTRGEGTVTRYTESRVYFVKNGALSVAKIPWEDIAVLIIQGDTLVDGGKKTAGRRAASSLSSPGTRESAAGLGPSVLTRLKSGPRELTLVQDVTVRFPGFFYEQTYEGVNIEAGEDVALIEREYDLLQRSMRTNPYRSGALERTMGFVSIGFGIGFSLSGMAPVDFSNSSFRLLSIPGIALLGNGVFLVIRGAKSHEKHEAWEERYGDR